MNTQLQRCIAFKALHTNKAGWIIPNPWDVGSAKVLEGLGFKALATTSGGWHAIAHQRRFRKWLC